MWIFIGRNGGFYKFNANCPDSEKVGSGPGSCGGKKLTLEQMLGKAKIPTKERIVSSEFKQQTTVENTINEAAKHGIKVSLTYDANCDEISSVNNILNNTIWYRYNFPELNINTVASETMGNTYAKVNAHGIIRINKRHARNIKEAKKMLKKNVLSKFHPEGCDTLQSIIDHEIGHLLDNTYGIVKSKEFIQIIGGLSQSDITNGLSAYAASDPINEIVSEAWSEYKNNPSPRPISKAIGDLIMKHAKKH